MACLYLRHTLLLHGSMLHRQTAGPWRSSALRSMLQPHRMLCWMPAVLESQVKLTLERGVSVLQYFHKVLVLNGCPMRKSYHYRNYWTLCEVVKYFPIYNIFYHGNKHQNADQYIFKQYSIEYLLWLLYLGHETLTALLMDKAENLV